MPNGMKKTIDTPFLLLVSGLVAFGLLIFTSAALGLLARDPQLLKSPKLRERLAEFNAKIHFE